MAEIVRYAVGEKEETMNEVLSLYNCSLDMLHEKDELKENLEKEIVLIAESSGLEVNKSDCFVLRMTISLEKMEVEKFLHE